MCFLSFRKGLPQLAKPPETPEKKLPYTYPHLAHISILKVTLHFPACLVITIPNELKIFLSLMQAVREENEAIKQEMEAVKRKTAEQASCLKSFLRKSCCAFFPSYSVFIYFK